MLSELKQLLQQCIKDSNQYFSAEALKEKQSLEQLAATIDGAFWEQLEPLENFFLFQLSAATKKKAPSTTVANSYCAALHSLVGDWWGLPSGTLTETAAQIIQQDEMESGLAKLLDDKTPLTYLEGESNTYSKLYHWKVSDLAASFLMQIKGNEYDGFADEAERDTIKQQLKNTLSNK